MNKKITILLALILLVFGLTAQGFAACSQAIPTSAKGNWLGGLYQSTDTYKIAFYTDSATWDATTEQYAATNEVSGSGYGAGGFTLDSFAFGTSSTTYWIDFADEVNNPVTFSAASTCVIIYDDTAADTSCTGSDAPWPCCDGASSGTCQDAAIYVGTFTSVQPSAGTLTVTFPTADASNAIIRLAQGFWEWLVPDVYAYDGRRDATVVLKGLSFDAEAN
jgi:hypothetical protein